LSGIEHPSSGLVDLHADHLKVFLAKMSELGQNPKSSQQANVVRCSPNNGLCQDTSAFPLRASGHPYRANCAQVTVPLSTIRY
jgi:hypothetical protein